MGILGAVAGGALGFSGAAAGATALEVAGAVMGGAGTGMSLGSAVGGATGTSILGPSPQSPTQQGQQAQQMVDPFAAYRPQYAQQLNQLMTNPASVQQQPGYQAQLQQGTQALQRQAAGTGQMQSGAELMALQNYASGQQNTWFQQQLQNLSGLSGAGTSPAYGGQAGVGAAQGAASTQSQAIGALPGAVKQLGNLFPGQTPTAMTTSVDPFAGTGYNPTTIAPQTGAFAGTGYGG